MSLKSYPLWAVPGHESTLSFRTCFNNLNDIKRQLTINQSHASSASQHRLKPSRSDAFCRRLSPYPMSSDATSSQRYDTSLRWIVGQSLAGAFWKRDNAQATLWMRSWRKSGQGRPPHEANESGSLGVTRTSANPAFMRIESP